MQDMAREQKGKVRHSFVKEFLALLPFTRQTYCTHQKTGGLSILFKFSGIRA